MDPSPLASRRWGYLIPVVMVMYLLAYLDRGNVALILPFIGDDLHLSSSAKGMISGSFFIGYLVLQVPSVLMARRWGARPVVAVLLVAWSLAAIACGFVQNQEQLYAARFALGVFEGGVLPVIVLLLSRWFIDSERSRANTLFLTCIPLSAVLASPFTGWLLTITHWRTVFIIEGVIPLLWLIPWLLIVRERPVEARWLPIGESTQVQSKIDEEQRERASKSMVGNSSYREVLRSRTVWQLIAAYFLWFGGAYGVVLWLPTVIKNALPSSSALHIGLLSAVPYVAALAGMLIASRYTHSRGSVRLWIVAPLAAAGLATIAGQATSNVVIQLGLLCVVATGSYLSLGTYLAVPSLMFPDSFAGITVAAMTTFGSIGGFAGPFAVGWLSDVSGSTVVGFLVLGGSFVVAAVIAAVTIPRGLSTNPTPSRELGRVS
ncbi:MFS transporter [Rhodococcus sp. ABRD24]|uniref:MFS transporter n=1 Tax=Rhodococcus sp. ABRD24 TaxID=2507582 RepID=UPI00103D6DE4|nr:MFS transporter [Rhodococcus sp. ABRD24]QBJ96929.1 MFS transporter [Rhodococcus sp. ABRD24]